MTAENNTPDPGAPDTIVLIHGLWMTPRSWERWVEHYTERGYRVLAPAYPGLEVEVEALREDPSPIEREPYPLETSLPGVFAAGDVRSGSIKRVASAVGEGSMAVRLVHQYLADTGV